MRVSEIIILVLVSSNISRGSSTEIDTCRYLTRSSHQGCHGNQQPGRMKNTLRDNSSIVTWRDPRPLLALRDVEKDTAFKVSQIAKNVIELNVPNCHNVLVTDNTDNRLVQHFLSYMYASSRPLLIVDLKKFERKDNDYLEKYLWGRFPCRTLLIDLTTSINTEVFSLLERSKFWYWSEVRVVVVGSLKDAKWALLQNAFRNTKRPMFLALGDETLMQMRSPSDPHVNKRVSDERVKVYGRCLYCGDGKPKVRFLAFWSLDSQVPENFYPFPGQDKDLQQHVVRMTSMGLFPYTQYVQDIDGGMDTMRFGDCADGEMMNAFAERLNFSYVVQNPEDNQWGLPSTGNNWTGMIGDIQYEKADLTTIISPNRGRSKIVDFARFYVAEIMDLVSLKPQVLPRYLVIIRPFAADVWLYLVLIVMLWGAAFWILQKLWSRFSNGEIKTLSESIFYSWAVILEDPPQKMPTNLSGQIMVGYWLLGCLIITTGYKSGLMAYLTVEGKTPPIETFEDLVETPNWQWGMLYDFFYANEMTYLTESPDPVVKVIAEYIQPIADNKEGLERVAKGGFSYIHMRSDVKTEIESYHTDTTGTTPFYISKHGHAMATDYGWGLRKGLPFGNEFKYLMNRMIESGVTEHMIQRIVRTRIAQNKKAFGQKQEKLEEDAGVVLRMSHMLGVFLFLFLGSGVSFSALVVEVLIHRVYGSQKTILKVVAHI